MTTAVKSLLVEAIRVSLQTACIDDIAASDETRAGLVKVGRYQDDPGTKKIIIAVHADHLLGPERDERRSSQGDIQQDGYEWNLPAETIGGSIFRWERGTVLVHYHLKRHSRDKAVPVVEVVVSRVINALHTDNSLIGISDDFSSRVHQIEVTDNYTFTNEGGEPATGRAFVDWRALISSTRSRS